ncbi:Crp/Fnr family transcriptional regulator [Streptomyces mobaraensis]|uniref:Crp/Fnr family transcriptional regulator n=2 Tax=Streptomyces TaxID=1883 RepID=UPI00163BEB43|nr:cyclic nucleotide-binding domain-containing protein [Streptomyces mobaraensis]MBC2876365.1 cyclic nucleotide-binding domain-containing protein [Streptomyces sp. TYQ1024]
MDTEAHFWSLLDATARAALLHIGHMREFPPKSIILQQNDTSSYLLVLRRGCVKVLSCTEAGYPAVLAIRNAGDLLGEQGGLDGRPRSASLVALTDVTALVLPADRFTTVLRERPAVGEAVRHVLATSVVAQAKSCRSSRPFGHLPAGLPWGVRRRGTIVGS